MWALNEMPLPLKTTPPAEYDGVYICDVEIAPLSSKYAVDTITQASLPLMLGNHRYNI